MIKVGTRTDDNNVAVIVEPDDPDYIQMEREAPTNSVVVAPPPPPKTVTNNPEPKEQETVVLDSSKKLPTEFNLVVTDKEGSEHMLTIDSKLLVEEQKLKDPKFLEEVWRSIKSPVNPISIEGVQGNLNRTDTLRWEFKPVVEEENFRSDVLGNVIGFVNTINENLKSIGVNTGLDQKQIYTFFSGMKDVELPNVANVTGNMPLNILLPNTQTSNAYPNVRIGMTKRGDKMVPQIYANPDTVSGVIGKLALDIGGTGGLLYGAGATINLPVALNAIVTGNLLPHMIQGDEYSLLADLMPDSTKDTYNDLFKYITSDVEDTEAEHHLKIAAENGILTAGIFGVGKTASSAIKEIKKARVKYLARAEEAAKRRGESPDSLPSVEELQKQADDILELQTGMYGKLPIRFRSIVRNLFSNKGNYSKIVNDAFNDQVWAMRSVESHAANVASRLEKILDGLVSNSVDRKEAHKQINNALMDSKIYRTNEYSDEQIIKLIQDKYKLIDADAYTVFEARKMIDNLSSTWATYGVGDDALVRANVGAYMKRSWKLFEDPNYIPSDSVVGDAVRSLVNDYKMDAERATNLIRNLTDKQDKQSVSFLFKTLGKISKADLTGRKKLTPELQKLLGPINNPTENFILTVNKLSKLVHAGKFYQQFEQIARGGGYLGDSINDIVKATGISPDDIVKIPDNIFPNLTGKFTTKSTLKALQGQNDYVDFLENLVPSFLIGMKSHTQQMATVYSVRTQVVNFIGGAQFSLTNGLFPFGEGLNSTKVLWNNMANKSDADLIAAYSRYNKLGVINTNPKLNEIKNTAKAYDQSLTSSAPSTNGLYEWLKKSETLKTVGEKTGQSKTGKFLIEGPQKLYQDVDNFFKISAFEQELKTLQKAMPDTPIEVLEEQAADIVRNTFPNYDRIPTAIRTTARYLPLGNFVSFPAEMIRTTMWIQRQGFRELASGNKTLMARGLKRLSAFGVSMATPVGLSTLTGSHAGLDAESREHIETLQERDYNKGSTVLYFRNNKNAISIINIKNNFSYDTVHAPTRTLMKRFKEGKLTNEDIDRTILQATYKAASQIVNPFISEDMLSEDLKEVFIAFNSADGKDSKGRSIDFTKGMTMILENYLPGTLRQIFTEIGREPTTALTGEDIDLAAKQRAVVTGITVNNFNPDNDLLIHYNNYKRAESFAFVSYTGTKPFSRTGLQSKPFLDNRKYKTAKEYVDAVVDYIDLDYKRQSNFYKYFNAHNMLHAGYSKDLTNINNTITLLENHDPNNKKLYQSLARGKYYSNYNNITNNSSQSTFRQDFFKEFRGPDAGNQFNRLYNVVTAAQRSSLNAVHRSGRSPNMHELNIRTFDQPVRLQRQQGGRLTARGRYSTAGKVVSSVVRQVGKKAAKDIEDIAFESTDELPFDVDDVKLSLKDESRPVFPAPQRFFDPEDKDFKGFLGPMGQKAGGRYLDMSQKPPKEITDEFPDAAFISVDTEGTPTMKVSKNILEGEPNVKKPKGVPHRQVKTNLIKRGGGEKGRWRWSKVPEGYNKNPDSKASIISVEDDKHYYSLSVVYPKGVNLKTYPEKKSEPRLRPTKQGQVVPGKIVGEVIISNKKHPIYDTIAVFGMAGAAVLPDNERKQKAGGGVESDMRRVDGTIKSKRGFLGPIKNNVTGKIMTEMYITVQIGGKEVGIPALVPNLTPKQREVLVNNDFEGRGKDIPLDIQKTAKAHAVPRIEAGLSPFYQDGEENRKQNAKGGKLTARGMKHCA